MANDNTDNNDPVNLPKASLADLLGKQSVRATFRLSSRAVDAISIVAGHLGIKQKSLFDHLIEDTPSLLEIAKNVSVIRFKEVPRVQKTFVLSRRTLESLEAISKNFDTPRDALVEYSIKRLEELISVEREKHRLRQSLLSELKKSVEQVERLAREVSDTLGESDTATQAVLKFYLSGRQALSDVDTIIEKGRSIETF